VTGGFAISLERYFNLWAFHWNVNCALNEKARRKDPAREEVG
jgi:hypothetical protein